MASLADPRAKWFLQRWAITVPSYPHLKFYRATPALFDIYLSIQRDPDNVENTTLKNRRWDEEERRKAKEELLQRYSDANAGKFDALEILIEFEGHIVGYGSSYALAPDFGNVGIVLNKSARGRGIATASMQVFIQIAFELFLTVHAGTMKLNTPMLALATRLGLNGIDEVVDLPGRGIVAEVTYDIKREDWKYIDMKVELAAAALDD
ncbi:MAG: hypothetical protein M1818_000388 [Claussenomyces sp. TS43310]|nr:MAG: hypothetical protein M1818_000388 [Claussenomyces sp. TS43310]